MYTSNSIRGNAIELNGTSDFINAGTPSNLNFGSASSASFTASVWFNTNSVTTQRILSQQKGGPQQEHWFMRLDSDNTIRFQSDDSDGVLIAASGGKYDTNSWYHICGVMDNGTATLYQNGVLVATDTSNLTGNFNYSSVGNEFLIGDFEGNNNEIMDGLIDDVRVYSRALSDEEIHQLYNWGTRGIDRRHELIRK